MNFIHVLLVHIHCLAFPISDIFKKHDVLLARETSTSTSLAIINIETINTAMPNTILSMITTHSFLYIFLEKNVIISFLIYTEHQYCEFQCDHHQTKRNIKTHNFFSIFNISTVPGWGRKKNPVNMAASIE